MPSRTRHIFMWVATTLCLAACTGHIIPQTITNDKISAENFIIVSASAGDTWAGLAQTYLGDDRKAWVIAQFNQIKSLEQGSKVVIPLVPMNLGGLTRQGYQTVPILVYSAISKDGADNTAVSLSDFSAQMKYLKENQYVTITLDQLHQFLNFMDQLPPKAVVLTFDTSQHWVYEMVRPILQQYQFTAALFLPTNAIGKPDTLTWSEVSQLAAAGFDIGTSGHTSLSLINKSGDEKKEVWLKAIEKEIATAGSAVKTHLDLTCRYFAYPDGETNDMLISFLKQYGFTLAFSREPGTNPFFVDGFRLHRTVVDAKMNLDQFQRQLSIFQTAELQ